MKENLRNVSEKQENRLNSVNSRKIMSLETCYWLKSIENLHHQKIFVCVCMYKMLDISAETWNKAGVSVIRIHENDNVNKTLLLLLCISDISKRWDSANIWPTW